MKILNIEMIMKVAYTKRGFLQNKESQTYNKIILTIIKNSFII